jgi:hypothetical protein
MVWELPGAQLDVCGEVYVVPSTTIEPIGFAVTMIDTVTGGKVVLVEFVVEELVAELVVVVVTSATSSRKVVLPLFPSM